MTRSMTTTKQKVTTASTGDANQAGRTSLSTESRDSSKLKSPTNSPRRTPSLQSPTSKRSSSRQSVTSSSLSVSTVTEAIDVARDLEPKFIGRWQDETEMDKSLKILKRKQAATVRLRKMNDIYSRLLEGELRLLDTQKIHISKEFIKEKRFIQDDIEEIRPILRFPRIDSATPVDSRCASRLSGRSQNGQICQSCMFETTNTNIRCRHFPCFLPVTYNSIGFTAKPVTYSVVGNYHQLLQRCKDLRPPTSKSRQTTQVSEKSIEEDSHAPRTTVKEKIRGLKQLVKEMKERNEKTKPRDWAVNYGEPMPRRIILKPVKTIA